MNNGRRETGDGRRPIKSPSIPLCQRGNTRGISIFHFLALFLSIYLLPFTVSRPLYGEQILVANHVHTKYTKHDPKLNFLKRSPGEILDAMEKICKRLGVRGAVIFQDHNSLEILEDPGFAPRPHVIPVAGVEWGDDHHLGIVNITSLKGLPKEQGSESLERIIRWVHKNWPRACVIINHPMKEADGWPDENPRGADAVEVWATPFFQDKPFLKKNKNEKAMAWQKNLKGVFAIGGSDFHFDIPFMESLARPANWVEVRSLTADEVVRAIRRGFVEITASPKVRPKQGP